ncbi:hypothetical protein [Thauera sp. SDU_THAU2]|uniref:hypothetical protein n=1 Tax=Thauera sp. SDU_THAU2 TaxID=3136633 RepID=UPI00311E4CCA
MDSELAQLEAQIEELIGLHNRLKADNVGLHGCVAQLDAENRQLEAKLRLAVDRLEALLDKLPEA